MADWFSSLANQAMKIADDFADSLVAQANDAQEEIRREQAKLKEEEEQKKQTMCSTTQLPWETEDESVQILCDSLRESILKLALNDRNFTVEPPNVSEVHFIFTDFVATALQLLKIDSNLAHVHSKVSPKMDEEMFWRNYYCRVIYLRAIIGVDGVAAKEEALRWRDSGIIFEPDFTYISKSASHLSAATGTTPVVSSKLTGGQRREKKQAGTPPGSGTAVRSMAVEFSDEELMKHIEDENDEADEEVRFSVVAVPAAGHAGGEERLGEEQGDDDVDDDEIDLGDLDDMDLLRELSEMDGDEDEEGQEGVAAKGTSNSSRERGELGSYEEVGKSDCNSSSSNAELEAQIALELANLSDDD